MIKQWCSEAYQEKFAFEMVELGGETKKIAMKINVEWECTL